jgi:hydrogenase maturation protease
MTTLVIGLGNPDRGDDAAGVLVARGLHGHRTKEVGDCSELIDLWEGEESVVIVDAMRSGAKPGTVTRFDVEDTELPARAFPSTHSFGLAETVELARALDRMPGELVIFGIEASGFNHGRRLTAAVKEAVCEVIATIEEGY